MVLTFTVQRSESHQIGEWELAFEVAIKMEERLELSDDFYKASPAHKLAEKFPQTKLVQLLLDFESTWTSFDGGILGSRLRTPFYSGRV